MKHGHKIPAARRAAMARRVAEIVDHYNVRSYGLEEACAELDISTPTARNLENYGRRLRREEA